MQTMLSGGKSDECWPDSRCPFFPLFASSGKRLVDVTDCFDRFSAASSSSSSMFVRSAAGSPLHEHFCARRLLWCFIGVANEWMHVCDKMERFGEKCIIVYPFGGNNPAHCLLLLPPPPLLLFTQTRTHTCPASQFITALYK